MDSRETETVRIDRTSFTISKSTFILAIVLAAVVMASVFLVQKSDDLGKALVEQAAARKESDAENAKLKTQLAIAEAKLREAGRPAAAPLAPPPAAGSPSAPEKASAPSAAAPKASVPDKVAVIIGTLYESGQVAVEKERMAKTLASCGEKTKLDLELCIRAYDKQRTGAGYNVKMGSLVTAKGGLDSKQASAVAGCFAANMPKNKDAQGNVLKNDPEAVDQAAFSGDCL